MFVFHQGIEPGDASDVSLTGVWDISMFLKRSVKLAKKPNGFSVGCLVWAQADKRCVKNSGEIITKSLLVIRILHQ